LDYICDARTHERQIYQAECNRKTVPAVLRKCSSLDIFYPCVHLYKYTKSVFSMK
jgi:hypothetical protein